GIFEPALDPTREEVYKFLETFLGEMAALFPDEYLHIGGDENEGKQWDRNPAIQAYMKAKGIKDNHALQAYFNTRLLKILQKHYKKMIGWDEVLQPELPKDIVIHSCIWPRTAAIAERLWSPRTVTDVNDMYRRMSVISLQLEEFGLTHKKNQ